MIKNNKHKAFRSNHNINLLWAIFISEGRGPTSAIAYAIYWEAINFKKAHPKLFDKLNRIAALKVFITLCDYE